MPLVLDIEMDIFALEQSIAFVKDAYGTNISPVEASVLIQAYIEWLDSEDRDFSDKMLRARKLYKEALEEHDDECPSRLWEDALEADLAPLK